jgi:hypothetical protein
VASGGFIPGVSAVSLQSRDDAIGLASPMAAGRTAGDAPTDFRDFMGYHGISRAVNGGKPKWWTYLINWRLNVD